jgi:phosphatidylglycerophosphatase A
MKPANGKTDGVRRAGVACGTFFGAGYFPKGPGTFASAITVALVLLLWPAGLSPLWLLAGAAALYFPGVWAGGQCEDHFGRQDPGEVVIDEVIGQMIGLAAVPSLAVAGWKYTLLGFILFRLFDITKPFPVRRSEKLPRGFGIMTDDCLAGFYAFAGVSLARWW